MKVYRSSLTFFCVFTAALLFISIAPVMAEEEEAPEETPAVNVEFTGDIRPRAEARTNHHFGLAPEDVRHGQPDMTDFVSQRARLGATINHQTWTALLQLQYATIWGATGGASL
ncbi:MAG: hypothetical protein ACNA8W_11505, partial [Bradymonadaceae bacterium]